jgi:hypothetical protein
MGQCPATVLGRNSTWRCFGSGCTTAARPNPEDVIALAVPRRTTLGLERSSQPAAGLVGTLISVNVGLPEEVSWQGRTVFTRVFKDPVPGSRRIRGLNVDGAGQRDLAGDGGERRAVIVYQMAPYRYSERELGRNDFIYRRFGQNFTAEGLGDVELSSSDHDALLETRRSCDVPVRGPAARVSARPARRRSSRGTTPTTLTRSNPPRPKRVHLLRTARDDPALDLRPT